jgi:hypothetical protein
MPAPVVLDLDDDVVALLERVQRDGADGGLAHGLALLARLDAVIDRVPHHVHERVRELLDDELVDLGLGAGDDQVHRFVGLAADLPHDARELLEHLPERHHAHLEDALLHRVEVSVERALQPQQRPRPARGSDWSRAAARRAAELTCARSPARRRCSSGGRASGCRRGPSAPPTAGWRALPLPACGEVAPEGGTPGRRASRLRSLRPARRAAARGSGSRGRRPCGEPRAFRGTSSISIAVVAREARAAPRRPSRDAIRMSSSIESASPPRPSAGR